MTQLDEPPAPRKVARQMVTFFRRSTPAATVAPARVADIASVASIDSLPARVPADRTAHNDDQHLVFWNAEASEASATHLSQAAAAWLQAVSTRATVPNPELPRLGRV